MTSFLGWRASQRRIDTIPPRPHLRTVKILCLGAPRTGTSSLTAALKILGFKCYEGMDHSFQYENQYPQWAEAIQAKYFGKGLLFTADDFDKILGGYDATTSWPSVLFADELLTAYPDAKVISDEAECGLVARLGEGYDLYAGVLETKLGLLDVLLTWCVKGLSKLRGIV